jgi:YhcH/YjgK/YiaL family protein
MISGIGRREFVLGALCAGAGRIPWVPGHPHPRVYRLSNWRSLAEFNEIHTAFEFLEGASVEDKAPGRYPIDGDRIYATVVQDRTRAVDTAQFEAHRKYIDLHYLIRGTELIGSADASSLREVKPYVSESEASLYERPKEYKRLMLKPGDFTVFFPGQAHMPGCYVDKSEEIKKVVVKILAEAK